MALLDVMLISIAFPALLVATYTDLKTREIPDWLNYGLLVAALGIRGLFSLSQGFSVVLGGILGFAFFFVVAYIFYLSNQWGGGDSKLLMAMGAVIGFSYPLSRNSMMLLWFFITLLFFGAVYGFVWMAMLAIKNNRKVMSQWKTTLKEHLTIHIITTIIAGVFVVLTAVYPFLWPLIIIPFGIFYLFTFVSVVEKSCFVKRISPHKLTEGDWLAQDVMVQGKKIMETKTVDKKDLEALRKLEKEGKIKEVMIKEGIPFIPSFLMAYLIFLVRPEWIIDILNPILF